MCGRGGVCRGTGVVVCCLLEVLEGCSCQDNILQCALEGVHGVGDICIRWKSVPLCYCLGKEAVFVVVVGGGYLSVLAWLVGTCLIMCGLEVFVGIDV